MHDPFIALATAASVTSKIGLGTGVCLITEHDPIVLAKTTASLDFLSGGRLLFGIGAGWNVEEMENHGTPFSERWKVLEDRIGAIKACWTQENSEHHGQYVDFEPIWSWPKPIRKPHPPIIMGASSPWGRERVARYCDGWIPISGFAKDFAADLKDLHERLSRHGRKAEDVEVSLFWAPPDIDALRRYRDLGADRVILGCPAKSDVDTLKQLDRYTALMAEMDN